MDCLHASDLDWKKRLLVTHSVVKSHIEAPPHTMIQGVEEKGTYHLLGSHANSFDGELSSAHVEEILQIRT